MLSLARLQGHICLKQNRCVRRDQPCISNALLSLYTTCSRLPHYINTFSTWGLARVIFPGEKSSGSVSRTWVRLVRRWVYFLAGSTCPLDFTGKFSGEAFSSHIFLDSHNIFLCASDHIEPMLPNNHHLRKQSTIGLAMPLAFKQHQHNERCNGRWFWLFVILIFILSEIASG